MMRLTCWPVLIWAAGGLAFVLGWFSPPGFERAAPVTAAEPVDSWCSGGFTPDGVYPLTNPEWLPADVQIAGSWRASDWQGEAETIWLPVPERGARIWVAGYPQNPGCALRAEFRRRDGLVVQVDCPIANPRETWSPWDVRPPADATAMRVVAVDRASGHTGWLAFTKPAPVPVKSAGTIYMAGQVFATFALTLSLVWGPGLLWRPRRAAGILQPIWILGAGPLLLAGIGVLLWLLGGVVAPKPLGLALVAIVWGALGVTLWRRRCALDATKTELGVLAVCSLCALAAVARAAHSDGPDGELYGGLIGRSLAVGDRSDSRISYYIPQIIHQNLAPTSAEAERYFTPWTFFSRGPLAGLAATPIVFATGGVPVGPGLMPSEATVFHRWQRFDPTGFAAYRIVLMTLASLVIFALFAVLVSFVGEAWALVGAGFVALCPFGVHEVMFTWPKFEATTWVLASFLLCHHGRSLGAGVALAVGFLYHPMAALWAPWLALWAAGRARGGVRAIVRAGGRFAAGFGVLAVPWMLLGQLPPQLEGSVHAGQGGFIEYFRLAGYAPATWESWWSSRAAVFANTFVPFWLHAFHSDNAVIGSVYGPVGPVVKFAFGWWNTLPLGLGLGLWALAVVALCRRARRLPAAIGLLIVGPALFLTAYWGAFVTGLMRECGHPLLVAVVGVTCVGLARFPGRLTAVAAHPLVPWLQLPETFLMLWLTTFLNPHQPGVEGRSLNPLFLVLNLVALGAAALLLSRARRGLAAAGVPTGHAADTESPPQSQGQRFAPEGSRS